MEPLPLEVLRFSLVVDSTLVWCSMSGFTVCSWLCWSSNMTDEVASACWIASPCWKSIRSVTQILSWPELLLRCQKETFFLKKKNKKKKQHSHHLTCEIEGWASMCCCGKDETTSICCCWCWLAAVVNTGCCCTTGCCACSCAARFGCCACNWAANADCCCCCCDSIWTACCCVSIWPADCCCGSSATVTATAGCCCCWLRCAGGGAGSGCVCICCREPGFCVCVWKIVNRPNTVVRLKLEPVGNNTRKQHVSWRNQNHGQHQVFQRLNLCGTHTEWNKTLTFCRRTAVFSTWLWIVVTGGNDNRGCSTDVVVVTLPAVWLVAMVLPCWCSGCGNNNGSFSWVKLPVTELGTSPSAVGI